MNRLIYIVLIGMLLSITYTIYTLPIPIEAEELKYFIMTSTAYSNHQNCIAAKWRDGKTATGTPIREGVVAINVDLVDGKWVVKSPLKLGQKIYIEGMGYFSVEDTGPFTEKDFHFDIWNLDVYKEDYEQAKEWGIKRIKVYVLGGGIKRMRRDETVWERYKRWWEGKYCKLAKQDGKFKYVQTAEFIGPPSGIYGHVIPFNVEDE